LNKDQAKSSQVKNKQRREGAEKKENAGIFCFCSPCFSKFDWSTIFHWCCFCWLVFYFSNSPKVL